MISTLETIETISTPAESASNDHEGALSLSGANPALVFAIPPDEATTATREGIPVEVLGEARQLLEIMRRIHTAKKVRPECERQSRLCANRWSKETLAQKYYLFIRGNAKFGPGHWRLLLNRAKAPAARINLLVLKFAFYQFWQKLGEDNQRCWAAAHTELIQIWRTGFGFPRNNQAPKQYTKIPGYPAWPEADPATHIPEGWSLANLMRHTSDPYDQAAARVGRAKASAHRLPVLTTRTTLKFGQYFEFDDHEWNQKVMFQKKPMRPLGFGCAELLSGSLCFTGFRPTIWDFEEEVKKKLTEREFMWFAVAFLCSVGYRNDATGTHLIAERGTAKFGDDFRQRIERIFNGRVITEVGGRFGRPAHDGQFNGQSKGNFRTKALIEGMWSLVDNQMAAFDAQTGKDRNHAPEQLYGIEQNTAAIMRRAEKQKLPAERLALLQFAVPTYHLWRDAVMDSIKRINAERRHKLEGWDKLGFVQPIWQLPTVSGQVDPDRWLPWSAYEQLPDDQKPLVKAMLDSRPELVTTLRMSRQDVFSKHLRELTQAPLELIPELVGVENAINGGVAKEVRRGLFSFDSGEIDSDPIHFYAKDASSRAGQFLPNAEKYICFVNPYDPRAMIACEHNAGGKLRVVAVCPRYELADRADEKEIQIKMGEQSAYEASARQRLNLRHADKAAEKTEMERHNERVFGGAPITGAEKVAARQAAARTKAIRNYTGDVAELVSHPAATAAPAETNAMEDLAVGHSQPAETASDDFTTDGLL